MDGAGLFHITAIDKEKVPFYDFMNIRKYSEEPTQEPNDQIPTTFTNQP